MTNKRLAAMYLMRLRYREHFGTDAGAAWRNIFVLVLFPWLLKYREGFGGEEDVEDYQQPTDDDDMMGFSSTYQMRGHQLQFEGMERVRNSTCGNSVEEEAVIGDDLVGEEYDGDQFYFTVNSHHGGSE